MMVRSHFLVRTEQAGRARYEPVPNLRRAMELAHVYSACQGKIAVLDATGRVIWKAIRRSGV